MRGSRPSDRRSAISGCARGAAREQKVGEIRARDQQQHADRGQQRGRATGRTRWRVDDAPRARRLESEDADPGTRAGGHLTQRRRRTTPGRPERPRWPAASACAGDTPGFSLPNTCSHITFSGGVSCSQSSPGSTRGLQPQREPEVGLLPAGFADEAARRDADDGQGSLAQREGLARARRGGRRSAAASSCS